MRKLFNPAFTLLEILVALLILSIIAVMLMIGLRSVIHTKDRIEDVSDRLANMQIAMTLIASDMRQIIYRPTVDNKGDSLPTIILYSGATQNLEFSRDGYINPQGKQLRSTLQRVNYRWYHGNLERGTWPELDRAPNSNPTYQVLIRHVTHIQWEFLGPENNVYSQWPSSQVPATAPLPKAVELTITIDHWGTIHRWFVVESYYRILGEPFND